MYVYVRVCVHVCEKDLSRREQKSEKKKVWRMVMCTHISIA